LSLLPGEDLRIEAALISDLILGDLPTLREDPSCRLGLAPHKKIRRGPTR